MTFFSLWVTFLRKLIRREFFVLTWDKLVFLVLFFFPFFFFSSHLLFGLWNRHFCQVQGKAVHNLETLSLALLLWICINTRLFVR